MISVLYELREIAMPASARYPSSTVNVSFQTLDVSDEASIQRAAKEFGNKHRYLDVLVNNAGIYPDEGVDISHD